MVSKFGGIPIGEEVEEASASGSKFGGVPIEAETPQPGPAVPNVPLSRDDEINKMISGLRPEDLSIAQQGALAELVKRGRITQAQQAPFFTASFKSGLPELAGKPMEEPAVQDEPEISLGEALKEGVKSFPSSAKKQITSLFEAITSPAKTWQGVKALSKDIYKNQMEVALSDMGFDPEKIQFEEGSILEHIEQTPALNAVVDDLEKTYGSYEGFKQAIAKDPARIMADISTLLVPSAKIVEGAATVAQLPTIAKAAGTVAKGAALTEPITAATAGAKQTARITSKLVGKAFDSLTPTGLYESAAKISTKIPQKERKRLINVALESDIMPTLDGLNKIEKKIETIDSTIADMIDTATATGKKMPMGKLFKEFKKLKEDRLLSTTAKESIRSINKVRKSMLEANAKIGRGRLTPKEVQKLKQTIYKDLRGAYENMKNSTASVKAQKAVAKSAKDYLEVLLPEIKLLNKTDGDLIKLRGALEGPASRIRNHQLIGIGAGIKIGGGATTGGMIGGPETAALLSGIAAVQTVFDHPMVKSKLAIVLDKLQKQGVNIPTDRAIKLMLTEKALKDTPTKEQENK